MKSVGHCPPLTEPIWVLMLAFMTSAFVTTTTQAEMPPSAYLSFQHDAPEALEVEITAVEQSTAETKEAIITSVVLAAKVLNVKRTATKLKPGAIITIKYEHRESKMPGWAGPSAVPILVKGDKYPAYLTQTGEKPSVYEPAAGGYTFRTLKE